MSAPHWWANVVEELTDYQRRYPDNLPGAVVAAETRHDRPLFASVGAGWSVDTICNIGSMTKTFIATALLLALEEAGRLDIETPVHTLPGMVAFAEDPMRRRIRVRHLLQHTSGMPVYLRATTRRVRRRRVPTSRGTPGRRCRGWVLRDTPTSASSPADGASQPAR
jgi:CubicO group peptidase (beta-lactamase class C family)